MKKRILAIHVLVLSMITITVIPAICQADSEPNRTLSPYFIVQTSDQDIDQLPLKATSVHVNISGVIADVAVTQVYTNDGELPLEAIYVFPGSTRAAVYGMQMTIGKRRIIAEIRKRDEARQEYEAAKDAGQSASLLEQQRPNVFQMNVANILPNDTVKVELRYTELLVPTDNVYEFVYPTVVGPRYSNSMKEIVPSENWIKNPYQRQGDLPRSSFRFDLELNAGLPIQDIACPTHKVNIIYQDPNSANVILDSSEKHGANRDLIMRYRLSGDRIESGLLLYEGEDENFFLLMLQPQEHFSAIQIPPREYIFIVDVSGSMHGFPLEVSKRLLKDLINGLGPGDRFNVLLFAGCSQLLAERSLAATRGNVRRAMDLIERQKGGGGTELLPALKRALSLPMTEGYSRNIVIATDGYVSVEQEAFDVIRNGLGNANVFSFGIGSSVNRHLIEGMARMGMGEPFIITDPEEAAAKADRFRKLIGSPLLTNIKIDYQGFNTYDVEPPAIPDLLADRPLIVFGKYQGPAEGTIEIKGLTGEKALHREINVSNIRPMQENSALRYLWARHRIAFLSDYNQLHSTDERITEVTNLGLAYSLLTSYTSFIAVDSHKRSYSDKAVSIQQPLPLPKGVSDYALKRGTHLSKVNAQYSVAHPDVESSSIGIPGAVKKRDEEKNMSYNSGGPSSADKNEIRGCLKLGGVKASSKELKRTVTRLIEKGLESLWDCCQGGYADIPSGAREMSVSFIIDPNGRVKQVRTAGVARMNRIEGCLKDYLSEFVFPAPTSGKSEYITIVIVFNT